MKARPTNLGEPRRRRVLELLRAARAGAVRRCGTATRAACAARPRPAPTAKSTAWTPVSDRGPGAGQQQDHDQHDGGDGGGELGSARVDADGGPAPERLRWWSWLSWVVGKPGAWARHTTILLCFSQERLERAASSGETTQRRAHAAVVNRAPLRQPGREHSSRVGVPSEGYPANVSTNGRSSRMSRCVTVATPAARARISSNLLAQPSQGELPLGQRASLPPELGRDGQDPAAPTSPTGRRRVGRPRRAAARNRRPPRRGWPRGSRPASARAPAARRTGRTASSTAPRRRRPTCPAAPPGRLPLPSTSGSRS